MYDITFLVFTYNEEKRVEYMLRCLQGHGEIIVIDNYSIDNTVELARKYTKNIFRHKNIGYIENENTMEFALSKVNTRWVYLALVDELIPLGLMQELHKLSQQEKYRVIEIYRRNFFFGQEIFNYGKHHLRMFQLGTISFKDNIVHGLGVKLVNKDEVLKIRKAPNICIFHFSDYTNSSLERSHNRYADLEAKQLHEIKNIKFSGIRALWKLFFYFFGTYIGLGGFRGGWPGLFTSVQIAYYKFSIQARLWEYDNGITPDEIEKQSNLIKEKIIDGYHSS